MSSIALKKQSLKTFPKREVWYGDFFSSRQFRSHIFAYTLLAPVAFSFGMLLALDVMVMGTQVPTVAVTPAQLTAPDAAQDPLVASVAAATAYLHVPGAYVDTYDVPPAIETPQFVVSKNDVAELGATLPYMPQSLADTLTSDWNQSFGLAGNIFVASVYEFGNQGASGMQNEINIKEAWHEYIDGLSTLLEPYVGN